MGPVHRGAHPAGAIQNRQRSSFICARPTAVSRVWWRRRLCNRRRRTTVPCAYFSESSASYSY